jgi:hypothetical protein
MAMSLIESLSIDVTSWSWWTSQVFALLTLICLVVSMQQKVRTKFMWWNTVGMFLGLIGTIFLGEEPAIILTAVNLTRNIIVLILSYHPKAKPAVNWIFGTLLIAALTIANIVFWEGWLNVMSIAVGTGFIFSFFQPTPKRMRLGLSIVRFPACAFAILTTNLVQAITEIVSFVSCLVGIIRLDIKRKNQPRAESEEPEQNDKLKDSN